MTPDSRVEKSRSRPSKRVYLLLSFGAGATVANLYYSQPLLAQIAREFHVRASAVSGVAMATQLGYAAGLLFLVPLGDSVERRRLLVTMTLCIVGGLLLVAFAPSLGLLIASSFVLGAATIVPQLVVPFAAGLAEPEDRGRVIGTVMSGLLVGVLLSRSVSGFLAAWAGWRTIYLLAAGGMAILALVFRLALPEEESRRIPYGELLRSLAGVFRSEPVLRRHALIGACGFASFSIFWTSLAFRLEALGHGSAMVGVFGLIGVTGALIAPLAGRLSDRLGARSVNGTALACIVLAFALMAASGASLLLLAVGVVLLDAGEQSSHISNQTRIFALDAALRNRINALYMVAFFIGGAAGSAIAGLAWQHGGWPAVCLSGALAALAGALAAVVPIRRPDQLPGSALTD